MRRLVPIAVAVTLTLPGCYGSSSLGDDGGPGPGDFACTCCGHDFLTSTAAACAAECAHLCADGAVAIDAGPVECAAEPLDLACFEHLTAGVASSITIVAQEPGDCFCDQALACDARVAGDRVLAIDSRICPVVPLCRACAASAQGTCDLPALSEGTWHVVVNGRDALDVGVLPPDAIPEAGRTCIRRARIDGCGATWTPAGFEVGRACHPIGVAEGTRAEIRVFEACGGCTQDGPCEVDVFDDVVRVRATRLPNACDIACPPACFDAEHVCLTPPLALGEYRVMVDGIPGSPVGRLHVGTGAAPDDVCILPPP